MQLQTASEAFVLVGELFADAHQKIPLIEDADEILEKALGEEGFSQFKKMLEPNGFLDGRKLKRYTGTQEKFFQCLAKVCEQKPQSTDSPSQ